MSALYVTSGDAYTGDRALDVTVVDPDGDATNLTAVDLTFMVKRYFYDDDDDALIVKTVGSGITVATPLTGLATIDLEEADTQGLDGRYLWELEADDAEGKVTLASGKFYVSRDLINE